jgi:hypothetical protein
MAENTLQKSTKVSPTTEVAPAISPEKAAFDVYLTHFKADETYDPILNQELVKVLPPPVFLLNCGSSK